MQFQSNDQIKQSNTKGTQNYFRSYSYQTDEDYVLPENFVPHIKPKKHVSCTFSPLKLRDSHSSCKADTLSDTEEQMRRFNFKRSHSKKISLSNASTSTDLPVIKPRPIQNDSYSKTEGNSSRKSFIKKRKVMKKSSTILLGLKHKNNVEKLHLLNNNI